MLEAVVEEGLWLGWQQRRRGTWQEALQQQEFRWDGYGLGRYRRRWMLMLVLGLEQSLGSCATLSRITSVSTTPAFRCLLCVCPVTAHNTS